VNLPAHFEADRRAEPPAIDADWGWVRRNISFSVVFSPSGRLVSFESLPTFARAGARNRRMSVPRLSGRARGAASNFLWDTTGRALGVRRSRSPSCDYCFDQPAFQAFRSFHVKTLGGTSDPALKAFLTFLDRWSPEMFEGAPGFMDKLDANLVFRFQYDDIFLHERHASGQIWKRFVAESASPGVRQAGLDPEADDVRRSGRLGTDVHPGRPPWTALPGVELKPPTLLALLGQEGAVAAGFWVGVPDADAGSGRMAAKLLLGAQPGRLEDALEAVLAGEDDPPPSPARDEDGGEGLSDAKWDMIKSIVPGGTGGYSGRRSDTRRFIDALLWVARSGGRWRDLPARFGSARTVKRRYYHWVKTGALERLFKAATQNIELQWVMLDAAVLRTHAQAAGARLTRRA
jgi:transposase